MVFTIIVSFMPEITLQQISNIFTTLINNKNNKLFLERGVGA
jgi:hypothetical protein